MKATLDALDERLRRLLAQPCGRAARIACAALVLLGFAGGTLAIQGTSLESLWNDQVPVVSGGMLAALAAGYLAGGISRPEQ